jgi:hypothetical protein
MFLKRLLREILDFFTWPIHIDLYCSPCSCLIFLKGRHNTIFYLLLRNCYFHTCTRVLEVNMTFKPLWNTFSSLSKALHFIEDDFY